METWVLLYICISIFLTIVAGLMSGLTLGLLSLDSVDLEVLKRSGTALEKLHASKIEPVVANTHLLLVSLLLTNAAAMETLPIFLDRLVPPTIAIVLSVTAVLIFGEIVPQAACKSYGLAIGAYCAPIVRLVMFLEYPIAKPISMVLDWALGEDHGALFRRGQLKALVDLHSSTEGMGGDLSQEEINVIRGALDLKFKQAVALMTPLDKVFMLPLDLEITDDVIERILKSGHSRIPVHATNDRKEIVGLILVKEMICLRKSDSDRPDRSNVCVSDLNLRGIPTLRGDVAAYDVIEELIGGEIVDETDLFVDNLMSEKVNVPLMIKNLPAALRRSLAISRLGQLYAKGGGRRRSAAAEPLSRSLGDEESGGGLTRAMSVGTLDKPLLEGDEESGSLQ